MDVVKILRDVPYGSNNLSTMYGQNNTFRLERDGEDIFSIEYYIPELIEVA